MPYKTSPKMIERLREYYTRQLRMLDNPHSSYNREPHKGREARKRVWHHNSFFGHVAMAGKNMQSIIDADSTTDEAKSIALKIQLQLSLLHEALKTRKDPK